MKILNQNKLIQKKSLFIAYAISLAQFNDIEIALTQLRDMHSKATHICYAYVYSIERVLEKYHDANEPKGSAGKPILSVIKKKNLTNILVVVVRYYGGSKLGMGGLVRAYSKSASGVLN